MSGSDASSHRPPNKKPKHNGAPPPRGPPNKNSSAVAFSSSSQNKHPSSSSAQASGSITQSFKSRTTDTTRGFLTKEKFADLDINELSKDAIEDVMGYQFLTEVQAATLPSILEGHDVLAKAKTGTGKTVGFLLPTIEKIFRSYEEGVGGGWKKPIGLGNSK